MRRRKKFLKIKNILLNFFIILPVFILGIYITFSKDAQNFLESDFLTFPIGATNITLLSMIQAIIAIFILFWFVGVFLTLLKKYLYALKFIGNSNKSLLQKIIAIILYFLVFVGSLDIIGIDITAFAILGGTLAIGIGFGLQKITSNFISGVILLLEKTVKDGDIIELEDGTFGKIKSINIRYTLLETFSGKEIFVPNESFIVNNVVNWTYSNKFSRLELNIGVSYDSDMNLVKKILIESAKKCPNFNKNKKPICYMHEFGSSSVNFILHFWLKDIGKTSLKSRDYVLSQIWDKFKDNNIVIPYPIQEIRLNKK